MTKVTNLLTTPDYEVYIGRKGKGQDGYFGNPFITATYPRSESIARYREYFYARLQSDEEFKQRVEGLRGKVLGCFCKPLACHGDVIIEYLNGGTEKKKQLKLI